MALSFPPSVLPAFSSKIWFAFIKPSSVLGSLAAFFKFSACSSVGLVLKPLVPYTIDSSTTSSSVASGVSASATSSVSVTSSISSYVTSSF